MINMIVSEILGIVLLFILSFAYFYLTGILLILIFSPIIILIAALRLNTSNKAKILILCFNMIYSPLLISIIPKLLLIIITLNYKIILNNMYMISYFSIFDLILAKMAEIYVKIVIISFIIMARAEIYVIIVIISFIIMIIYYLPIVCLYEFMETHNLKEYINKIKKFFNKKFFGISLFISLISGPFLLFLILTTHSSYYIRFFFLIILLIASILSYILLSNRKNLKNKNGSLSENTIEFIISWSSLLELNFFEIKKSIEYIFEFYPILYILFTYGIIVITIFLIISVMSLYVYAVNTNRNLENMVKWIILGGFSIALLTVSLYNLYLSVNRSIWYIVIGLLSFCIFIYPYCRIYSHILKNINKKNWDIILSIALTIYAILDDAIFIVAEKFVLYIAIGYLVLLIIFPYIAIKYLNKNDDHDKNNLISEK